MRLALQIVVLMFLFTVFVGGAILVGHTRPEPNKLQGFGFALCDDKPCLKGVVPGITLKDQAAARLPFHLVQDDYTVVITYSVENNVIASVQFMDEMLDEYGGRTANESQMSTLKDVLLLYGAPCGVTNFSGSDWGVVYPSMSVDFYPAVGKKELSLDAPIVWVELLDPKTAHTVDPGRLCGGGVNGVVPWYGLASAQYYRQHGLDIQDSQPVIDMRPTP